MRKNPKLILNGKWITVFVPEIRIFDGGKINCIHEFVIDGETVKSFYTDYSKVDKGIFCLQIICGYREDGNPTYIFTYYEKALLDDAVNTLYQLIGLDPGIRQSVLLEMGIQKND